MSIVQFLKDNIQNDNPELKKKIEEKESAIKEKSPQLQNETDKPVEVNPPQKQPAQQEPVQPEAQQTPPEEDKPSFQDRVDARTDQRFSQYFAPESYEGAQIAEANDPRTWGPDYTQMGFIEKSANSFMRGFGKHVIGGTGDMIQLINPVFGMDIADGNKVSRFLQEEGKLFEEAFKIYLPEEMQNPEWNVKTFMNPDFWSGHIAEYIPQLVEFILLSKGAAGAAKSAASKLAKQVGTKTAKKYGKTATKNITEKLGKNATDDIIELNRQGEGVLGKISPFTTEKTLTKSAGIASEIVGGGLSMNILAGLQNAGQLVNEYKDTGLFTEDELRSMASGTVMNNMAYLPIDMISWGLTYGQATNLFGRAANRFGGKGIKNVQNFFDKGKQLAYSSKTFARMAKPVGNMINRVGKAAGRPIFEGFEESYQETFEEWAKMRAEAEVTGADHPGLYDVKSFMDYYNSKENEATKAISFALGALGGMGGNIMNYMNNQANDAYNLWNRSEMVKRRIRKQDREAEMMQGWHIRDQFINNIVSEGKIDNESWVDSMVADGTISEEQGEEFKEVARTIEEEYDRAEKMNIRGKVKFLQERTKKQYYEQALKDQAEIYTELQKALSESAGDNKSLIKKKGAEIQESYEMLTDAIKNEIALADQNIENLLLGKEATPSYTEFLKGPNGETVAVGLTKEQYEDFYNQSDEEIFDAINQIAYSKKKNGNLFQRLTKRGKEIFGKIKDPIAEQVDNVGDKLGIKKDDETSEEPVSLEEFENITPDDQTTELNEETYQAFQESGTVPSGVVRTIADKLKKSPEGDTLSQEEKAVQKATSKAIEKLNATEEQAEEETQTGLKNIPEAFVQNLDNASKKKGSTQERALDSLEQADSALENADINQDNEKNARRDLKKLINSKDAPDIIQRLKEQFGTEDLVDFLYERLSAISENTETENDSTEARADNTEGAEATNERDQAQPKEPTAKEKAGAANKLKNRLEQANAELINIKRIELRQKIYNPDFEKNPATQEEIDRYLTSVIGKVTYGPQAMDKSRHINQHLKTIFPGQPIQAYAMTNLIDSVGTNAVGYSLLSTILIDEKVWEQDEIFMHEASHIYYNVTKDTEATKRIIDRVSQNKPLIEQIMNDYDGEIKYRSLVNGFEFYKHQLSEEEFDELLEQGAIEMLPLKFQDLILEEAFVNYLQGPLSERYNRYFDRQGEDRRQFNTRKWWRFIKESGKKAPSQATQNIIKSLNDGLHVPFANLESFVLDNFATDIKNKDISVTGRAMRIQQRDKQSRDNEEKIQNQWLSQFEKQIEKERLGVDQEDALKKLRERWMQENEVNNAEVLEDTSLKEELEERIADELDAPWDKSFDSVDKRMGKIIRNFGRKYAKDLYNINRKQYNAEMQRRAENPDAEITLDDITSIAFFNTWSETDFKREIMQLAEETESPFQFIRILQEAKAEDFKEFMKYMQEVYPEDYLLKLRSAHLLYSNSAVVPAVIHTISKNGTYSQRDAFSDTEERILRNNLTNIPFDTLERYMDDLVRSYNGDTAAKIVQLFSNGMNTKKLLENKYLFHEQKVKPLVNALIEGGYDAEGNVDAEAIGKMIINTNRQYSSLSVVKNPNGDNISSRQISNRVTRLMKNVRTDLLDNISEKDFFKKYRNTPITQNWWYEYKNNKNLPTVNMVIGNENFMNNSKRNYDNSVADQQLINEMLQFIENPTENEYNASMDIFGDSKRRYQMKMYRYDSPLNENGKLTVAGKKQIKSLYTLFKQLREDRSISEEELNQAFPLQSYQEFETSIVEALENWKRYMRDHGKDLYKINNLVPYYNNNKTLNKEGKNLMESFMFSRMVNTYNTHATFNPGIPLYSIIKRNKGNIAPTIAVDKNLRMELLMWADERNENRVLSNDSGQYILEEHAMELQKAGKGVIDFNYGFKLFSHTVENDPESPFFGKTHQMKGYTTILSEKAVAPGGTQQDLKVFHDILKERYQKYIDSVGGQYNPEFGNGAQTYIPILTPVSSEKATLFNKRQLETLKQVATIEALKDPEKRKTYIDLMDRFYYKKDKFIGLDGSNMGPQQVMDKQYLKATFSVQAVSSILAGARGSDLQTALEIQRLIGDQKAQTLDDRVIGKIDKTRPMSTVDFVLDTTNEQDANPLDIINLKKGLMPDYPGMSEFIGNQVRKQFINNGNRLRVPGTYGQTISDRGYRLSHNGKPAYINGTNQLQDYSTDSEGNTTPLTVILPKNQKYDNVRSRELFWGDSTNSRNKYLKRLKALQEVFDLKKPQDFTDFMNNHVIRSGKTADSPIIGYYIPGEIVMMTRIPHNSPAFMGVAEVVGFNETDASSIMVPSEYKNLIGSDDDGDALFIYKEGKNSNGRPDSRKYGPWNKALKMMIDQWLSPRMKPFLEARLVFEEETQQIIDEIQDTLDIENGKFIAPFSAEDYRRNYNNSVIAKQTIGIAFNNHRILNTLAAYEVGLQSPFGRNGGISITLGGKTRSRFADFGSGKNSRIHRSTILANIVLDSTKNGHADALNLNMTTIGPAMALVNLGFTIKDIGMLFNHPSAKKYISRFVDLDNDFIDTGSRGNILHSIKEENMDVDWYSTQDYYVEIDPTDNASYYNSKENEAQIYRLMDYLFRVNMDISRISNILSGHKKIEKNPHALNKQIEDFKQLMDNRMLNQTLTFPEEFAESEEIKSYLHTAEEYADMSQRITIHFNESVSDILKYIEKQITVMPMTDKQLKFFSERMLPAIYSRLVGINNIPVESINTIMELGEEGAVSSLENYIMELASDVIYQDPNNEFIQETALDHSLLLNEAIEFNDDIDEIQIARTFENKSLQEHTVNQVRKEFGELPPELQFKLVIYDLVKNAWSGPKSISPVFSDEIINQINMGVVEFQQNQEKISSNILRDIFDQILQQEIENPFNHFPKIFINEKKGDFNLDMIADRLKKPQMADRLAGNEPLYFEVRSMAPNGRIENGRRIYKLNPLDAQTKKDMMKNITLNRRQRNLNVMTRSRNIIRQLQETKLKDQIELVHEFDPDLTIARYGDPNIDIIAIPDASVTANFDVVKKKDDGVDRNLPNIRPQRRGMAYRTDFNNFQTLDYLEPDVFHAAMQYKTPVSPEMREVLYNQYMVEKRRANAVIQNQYNNSLIEYRKAVKSMSDDELLRSYKKYGERNIYAYSVVLVPVLLELTARASEEQSKLTGRYEDGQDIGVLRSYFQSNNIQSNHPATQAIQRALEKDFKNFLKERKQYIREINKVTEALYKEKLGIKPTGYKLIDQIKRAFVALFHNRQKIYEKLYGGIVDLQYSDDGTRKAYRLKSKIELDRLLKEGKISEAEFDFATMFRKMTKELHPNKRDFNTGGFVPAVGMTRLEAYANRGLLGVLTNSKGNDQALEDVRLIYQGEEVSFKVIQDIFRNDIGNNFKNVKEYITLKRKAKKLLKQGINEDGSPIKTSSVQNLTLLGDGFVNNFANDGYVPADNLLSLDLNKALTEFVHTTLFVNGNKNFEGFTKLQAKVDGLLLHNNIKGYKNQEKFARKVYKEYFLKGNRTEPPTTTDKVIEALTRANMLYIMGYKLLLVGKAAYIVGNVVVGKYHNIKNHGGKAWSKGESRFWGLNRSGNFGTKKALGVLDTLDFMDINLYDTVNMEKSSGLDTMITDIALMPMTWSEKWIQGVHFLGLLSDEQWNKFDENGKYKMGVDPIPVGELTEMENKVKGTHGRGYTPTDQRMIQQYSWGKSMMQFARFIPTMFEDRFSKKDINIYGKEHIGSLRLVWDVLSRVVSGEIPPKDIKKYRAQMSPEMRQRFDSGLRGLGMTSLAMFVGSAFNYETANDLTGDANYLINGEKLEYKLMPSTVRTTHDAISSLF